MHLKINSTKVLYTKTYQHKTMIELLTSNSRKSLVEKICTKFHQDGITRLKIIGHVEKYTPLYHFRIAKPREESFIFITDLFGDSSINPGLMIKGFRMQYHGTYEGLDRMILQGVAGGLNRPSFRIHAKSSELTDENKLAFDTALKYIHRALALSIPETIKFDVYPETFSDTYYLDID